MRGLRAAMQLNTSRSPVHKIKSGLYRPLIGKLTDEDHRLILSDDLTKTQFYVLSIN